MSPETTRARKIRCGFPRMRGDEPARYSTATFGDVFSPHARG